MSLPSLVTIEGWRNFMDEDQTITGEILAEARKNTEKILARKNLSAMERANFENQHLILMFIEGNHKKTTTMYADYQKRMQTKQNAVSIQNALLIYIAIDIIGRLRNVFFP
jgi:hypothetical protein